MSDHTSAGFRLSPQQEHIWAVGAAGGAPLLAQLALRLDGPLDPQALRRALDRVAARHESLRTFYPVPPGMALPLQRIAEPAAVPLREIAPREAGACDAAVAALLGEAAQAAPDLGRGPALDAFLFAAEPGRAVLGLTLPVLSADLPSLVLLAGEIAAAYDDGCAEREEAGDPVQYLDFSEWLNGWLEGGEAEPLRQFWKRENPVASPELPFARSGGAGAGRPRTVAFDLDPELIAAADALAQAADTAWRDVLLTAWLVLLGRLAGCSEVVAASAVDGRKYAELEPVVGLLERSVPVRCRLAGEPRFAEALRQVAGFAAEAYEQQEGFAPRAGVLLLHAFSALELPAPRVVGGVEISIHALTAVAGRFDLHLSVLRRGAAARAELRFDPGVFDEADVRCFAGSFTALLASAVRAPATPVDELEILSPATRRELVEGFNRTAVRLEERPVHELIAAQAARTPELPALRYGERVLSYGELGEKVRRLAAHLRGRGVGPETVVGILVEPSFELVTAILGVLEAGGAYLPIDPSFPQERRDFLLADSGAALVLTRSGVAAAADGPEEAGAAPRVRTDPDHLAYVIYTSGSTGRPKGTLVPHRGLTNYLLWALDAYGVARGEGAPLHSPVAFDLSVTSLFAPLLAGAAVTLVDAAGQAERVEGLAATLRERSGFGFVKLTPGHAALLGRQLGAAELAGRARVVILGGEPLRADEIAFWREADPAVTIVNEYGPTETVVGCTAHVLAPGVPAEGVVPIGRPIANARIYLLDHHGAPVPPGVPGELFVGGAGVARGYLGRPELTAARFVPDTFSGEPGARLYRSGDLARHLPEGAVEFLGRADDQVKIRGYRVEPGEVEAELAAYPGLAEVAVVARPGADGAPRLVAYAVAFPGWPFPMAEELRAFLGARLPEHMVPPVFVALDVLPLTANGKVDRRALPDPELAGRAGEAPYVAPRTLEEEVLAAAWAQTLGRDRVGIDDRFFALGGDSIRSIQVVVIAKERGLELTVGDLFEHQTIRELARVLRLAALGSTEEVGTEPFGLLADEDRRRLPEGLEDAYPLTQLQAGMIYHIEYSPDSPIYHPVFSFHLKGGFREELFRPAVQALVVRHPALRTTFDLTRFSRPLQLVHRTGADPLGVEDLRGLPAEERGAAVKAWIADDKRRPFDLERLPLFRYQVHVRTDETFQFTLSFHHAIFDGWSDATMVTELFRHYFALLAGESFTLEPPAATYRDFVALERAAVESPENRAFWREKMRGIEPMVLPRWRPSHRRVAEDSRIAARPVPIPLEVSEGLKRAALAVAVPLKDVLLAAHLRVMAALSGKSDVLTCVVSSGRPETRDGERVVGIFVNSLPFRLRLPAGSWADLIRATFDAERESLPFRRFPMAETRRLTGVERLSETLFYFTDYHLYHSLQGQAEMEVLDQDFHEQGSFTLVPWFRRDPFSGQVQLDLLCDANHLSAAQVEAIHGLYQGALSAIAADLAAPWAEVPLLPAAARHQLVAEWNDTAAAEDLPPVHLAIEARAAGAPGALALVSAAGARTAGDLVAHAGRLAASLRARGVGPEQRVGVALDRSPDGVVAVLAVLAAGGAFVPLDPAYPRERLAWMIADAGLSLVLTRSDLRGALPGGVAALELDGLALDAGSPGAFRAVPPEAAAYVIYTSGSTGRPKGVVVSHRGLANLVAAQVSAFDLRAGDRVLQFASPSFDASVSELFTALAAGAELHLATRDELLPGPGLVRLLTERGITHVTLPPSALAVLPPADLPALRILVAAGEACAADLVDRWAPGRRFLDAYGPTEASVCATIAACAPGGGAPAIGRPIRNVRVVLLDEEMQLVPPGVAGELWIGGAGTARGYLGRPDLTADRFRPDPFTAAPGGRLYRTGDLARHRLPGGALDFLGRIDRQVKIRGYRIEPGEVEAALRAHPAVAEAVVVARRAPGGGGTLVAYAVPRGDADVAELRAFLAARLPEPLLPAVFVLLAELPLTPSGKVDRAALPAPEEDRSGLDGGYVAPRTPAEAILAEIWARVLGRERIGVDDNFFHLGGDSILSVQVASRAAAAGLGVTPRLLFEHPTIAGLLRVAAAAPRTVAEESEPETGPVRLTPIQRWFFEREPPEPHHFNQALLLAWRGLPDTAALESALAAIVATHDALRRRYVREGAGWGAVLAPAGEPARCGWIDLGGLPPALGAAALGAAADELHASLDLARGPLTRMVVLDRGGAGAEREVRLLWTIHHLAVDAVSWRTLLSDLHTAYDQALGGGAVRLPARTTSLRRWALLLEAEARTDATRREAAGWLAAARPSPLPVDLPGGANTVASARTVEVALDREETRALLGEVHKAYRTVIDEVLLAALARAFAGWGGGGWLRVDREGHGRDEERFPGTDLSRTVGWLTAVYPVDLDLREVYEPAVALESVKERLRREPRRGLGWGLLRHLGDPETAARLAALPRAGINFNYLGQLDQGLPELSRFGPAPEPVGRTASRRGLRDHLLEVNARVAGGRLRIEWTYSEALHRRSTLESLAERYREELRGLIAHCLTPGAGGYTPSDFPHAGLDRRGLDLLLSGGRAIEDVYPLTPMQQGLLYHSLRDPEAGGYAAPVRCTLTGRLDAAAFHRAWRRVVDGHPALRTGFRWEGLEAPLQVVFRGVELAFRVEDWRPLAPGLREARLTELMAAESRSRFDLGDPPLARLALLQVEDEAHVLVSTFHHLILDGWSLPLLLADVFALYAAEMQGGAEPSPARPFRDYVIWLARQDRASAEAFWRRELAGFRVANPLGSDPVDAAGGPAFAEREIHLAAVATAALQELSRRQGLTLNTLVQGAWALLLSHATGDRDLVFGVTVSGRPAELAGSESMVGLFINTLPVRTGVEPAEMATTWLARLQEKNAELRQYESSALADVLRWSDAAPEQPLFESIVVFENYPTGALDGRRDGLRIEGVRFADPSHYPLTLTAALEPDLKLRINYDRRRFLPPRVDRLLAGLATLLAALAADPGATAGSLLGALAETERRLAEARERELEAESRGKLRQVRRRAVAQD